MLHPSRTLPAPFMRLVLLLAAAAALVVFPTQPLQAQNDRPSGFVLSDYALVGANVTIRPGRTIPSARVVIRNGLIAAVGSDVEIPASAEIIDCSGLFLYAGFIDAAVTDLVDPARKPAQEPGRTVDVSRYVLAATPPDQRHGLTPEFRATDALKRDAAALDALRKSGLTAACAIPSGRIASGLACLLATGNGPVRETLILENAGLQFELEALGGGSYPSTLMGATAHLRQAFADAERHALHRKLFASQAAGVERPPADAVLESLQRTRSGEQRAIFFADTRDEIHRALDFSAAHNLKVTLCGCREAYRAIDRIREAGCNLIVQIDYGTEPKIEAVAPAGKLEADVKDPLRVQEDRRNTWRQRVAQLAELKQAGVSFAVTTNGMKNRNDLFAAMRAAVEYGLPENDALAALTTDAAKILGIEQRLGAIETGALAQVLVMTGPWLHPESRIRHVIIDREHFSYNDSAKPVALDPQKQASSPALPNLAGTWSITIDSSTGKVAGALALTQQGATLGGTFRSEQGEGRVSTGTIKDGAAEFTVAIGAGAQSLQLRFTTTAGGRSLEGSPDVLGGELKTAFGGVAKWSAIRDADKPATTPEQGAQNNPVALSLDTGAAPAARVASQDDGAPVEAPRPEPTLATVKASPPMDELSPQDLNRPTELQADRLRRSPKTGGDVLIRNATVLTGAGQSLKNTSILVRHGKIAALGGKLKPDPGMAVIDANGKFVMPGIIDTHSHIKITAGVNEMTLSIVPEVSVRDVVNTDDASEYRALAGGVTTARLLHGSANVIGGQDAVVKLKYGEPASAQILFDAPQGVKFALGENVKFQSSRFPNTRLGVEATLNRAFLEAVDYRRRWLDYEQQRKELGTKAAELLLPPRRDFRLEALADIVNHEKFIHSHCYRADEILMLLRVASNLGVRVWSLQHVLEGYKVAPEIVAHGASCSTFSDWWAYKMEAFDAIPHNAALLQEAGANVVVKSDDWELIRHLYLEAAKTVRYGNMSPDDAIAAITLHPARELGLSDRIGSIEAGKDADLAIFNGHPLNAFSRCETTLIEGEVYFSRAEAPSAMSAATAKRTASPVPFSFTSPGVRSRPIDCTPSETGRYAIVGATLYPVAGPALPRGSLLIEDGKIAALGPELKIPEGTRVIDGQGLHVTPGFIDAGTTLGLVEIGKVRETHDFAEGGNLQPDLRAGVAINPDSELIPVSRAGGITTILVRPIGGVIAGQASLVQLAGWTAPEMVQVLEAGLQINWPSGKPQQTELSEFLKQGRLYLELRQRAEQAGQAPPIADPRYEALKPYLAGERPVLIEAVSRKAIAEALLFAETEKLKIVVTGAADAWLLADELKQRDVPVIVGPVMMKPVSDYDPFDAPYANPGRLHEAGVRFCIRSNHAANSRNTPFEAAMAVAYGLPEEAALRAVTLSAAEILGIADRVGSLSPGKSANIVIHDGPPLQIVSQIKAVFIDGTPHAPESRQTKLYDRYRQRLKPSGKPSPTVTSTSKAAES